MTKYASAAWVAVPGAYAALTRASFPRISEHPAKVEVMFGSHVPTAGAELVAVSALAEQPAISDWATAGTPGKIDQPDATIRVFTAIEGFDEHKTWARLAVLGQVVEETFRSLLTGKPIIPDEMSDAGIQNLVLTLVRAAVEPAGTPGAGGWLGACEYSLRITARI